MSTGKLKVTWTRSAIGRTIRQKRIIEALGLRKLNHTVIHVDTPTVQGMLTKVSHLVRVEAFEG